MNDRIAQLLAQLPMQGQGLLPSAQTQPVQLAGDLVPMPITPGTYEWNRLNSQLLQQEGKSGPPAPIIPLAPPNTATRRG